MRNAKHKELRRVLFWRGQSPVDCGRAVLPGTVPSCFAVLDAAGSRVSLGLGDKRGTSVRGSIGMFCDYFDIILA